MSALKSLNFKTVLTRHYSSSLHHEYSRLYVVHYEIDPLQQALSRHGTACHYTVVTALSCDLVQLQDFQNLTRLECASDVLFIAKHQKCGSRELFLSEKLMQFISAVLKTQFVTTVDNPDESICLLEIVAPV